MLYFKIFNSGDINEIGHYPQTGLRKGYNPRLSNSHWQVKHNEFPDFMPNYELELHTDAFATNYLDGTGDYSGFLVDRSFKKVLEAHKLPPHHFYPIKVYQKNNLLDYYWFHFIVEDLWEFIDVENSTIKIQHKSNSKNYVVQPMISKECIHKLSKFYSESIDFDMQADKLFFKKSFPKYDIISIDYLYPDSLISTGLKRALEDAGLTGYEIKLFDRIYSI